MPNKETIGYHFYDQLLPSYVSYNQAIEAGKSGGLRLMGPAKLMSEYIFHLYDRLQPYYPPKTLTRKAITGMCSDFGLLADIANAFKHGALNKTPDKRIEGVNSIEEIWVCILYNNPPEKPYGYGQTRVMIKLLTGEYRDLQEIATNVLNFWCAYLHENGFLQHRHRFVYHGDDHLDQLQARQIKMPKTIISVPYAVTLSWLDRVYDVKTKIWYPYGQPANRVR